VIEGTPTRQVRARIGEKLRQHVEDLIERYVERMREDPQIPLARTLPDAVLEDHALSFISDVIQSLVVVEHSAELDSTDESELQTDGTEIQLLIGELHGRQRYRVGWTESALQREYLIFTEEIEALAARYGADGTHDPALGQAIDLFTRLLARARDASMAGYRSAAAASG
jgi:hypothetical protein